MAIKYMEMKYKVKGQVEHTYSCTLNNKEALYHREDEVKINFQFHFMPEVLWKISLIFWTFLVGQNGVKTKGNS